MNANSKSDIILTSLFIFIYLSTIPAYGKEEKNTNITKERSNEVKMNEPSQEKLINESLPSANGNQSQDTVLLQTEKGPIKIKLYTKEAPVTTSNFKELASKGFYNGTVFHRVVPNFVIQGGDPLGDGTGNYIDPESGKPRFIKLETNPSLKFDRPGRVGMARTKDPNSASCQFFITLKALPSLDPGGVDPFGYSVFGQVTEDTFKTVLSIIKDSVPAFPTSERPANPVKIHSASLN